MDVEDKIIFVEYIKERKNITELFTFLIVIVAVVGYLSKWQLQDVLYVVVLETFVFCCFGVADFKRYYNRFRELVHLQKQIVNQIAELPQPIGLLEETYQELLKLVQKDKVKQLTKADQARTDMIDYYSLWAHQIKTPIAGMSLLLQMSDGEDYTELKNELFRIEQYVDMVLSYLRLGSESNDFLIKEYNMEDLVKKSVRKFASQFIHKKLYVDMEAVQGQVVTDEKWCCFVIEQLLANAIKYTDQGGVTIAFTDRTLTVTDTGIGIAEDDLPRIFEKGFTGYNGRMNKKSTGIGLYLCKMTMEKLGGHIFAESEVGTGTNFVVEFPSTQRSYE